MSIELTIGPRIKESKGKPFYMVKLTFSHGDADHNTEESHTFDTEGRTTAFLEVIHGLLQLPYGKDRDRKNRDTVPGYTIYFVDLFGDDSENWPRDITSDYSYDATLWSYEVTYTDEQGDVYKVETKTI